MAVSKRSFRRNMTIHYNDGSKKYLLAPMGPGKWMVLSVPSPTTLNAPILPVCNVEYSGTLSVNSKLITHTSVFEINNLSTAEIKAFLFVIDARISAYRYNRVRPLVENSTLYRAAQNVMASVNSLLSPASTGASAIGQAQAAVNAANQSLAAALTGPSPSEAIIDTDTIEIPKNPKSRVATTKFATPKLVDKPYWYESKDDEKLYQDFIDLRVEGHTVNLLIAGPSGSGKTVGVQRLAERLGIPCHIINCQAVTTPEKWLGQMHADPEKGTYFIPSQHLMWVERVHDDCQNADRCIILYDEITRLRPELNNMTYSLFDTQRGLEVPQMGRRVLMDPNNIIVATANIGAAFSGTHTQDRAFRERFSITIERTFPPKEEEIKIVNSATGLDKVTAATLVNTAEHSRRMWTSGDIDSPISTRTLVSWALLVAGGYSPKKAAEYTVLPLYSDDGGAASDRAKISGTIEGKIGG